MYVIKKMRLNKFERKPIVSNRALYLASGPMSATITSKDTADCYNEPTLEGASKTKALGLAEQIGSKAVENAKGDDPAQLSQNAKDM